MATHYKQHALGQNRKIIPDGPEAQALVRNEVSKHFRSPRNEGHNISVPCCFHVSDGGFSRTLSICVEAHTDGKGRHIPVGLWHCWSCGKAGDWNTLAVHEGLQCLHETDNYELEENVHDITWERQYEPPPESELSDLPEGWIWKRRKEDPITYETLMSVDAKIHRRKVFNGTEHILDKRLHLPALEESERVGHVGAALQKQEPKYLNSSGPWSLKHFLFWDPAERIAETWIERGCKRFCVVVEGPGDGLRMLQHSIPGITVLGVNAWSMTKANMIASSYDMVFAFGDGDKAGKAMNAQIKNDLSASMEVHAVKMPKRGLDPAKLSVQDIEELKTYLRRKAKRD